MKKKFDFWVWPAIYIAMMGISNFIVKHVLHATYGSSDYVAKMMPFLLVMVLATLGFLAIQRENLVVQWKGEKRYKLILPMFVPLVIMAVTYWFTKGNLSSSFLTPLFVTLLVGIGEEVTFRRILVTDLMKKMPFQEALLYSGLIFSSLHAVNVFAGMPVGQMLSQLVSTFVAGLCFTLLYLYTKNIYIMIIQHWLWDYVLLSGAVKSFPIFEPVMLALTLAEFVLLFILYREAKAKNGNL